MKKIVIIGVTGSLASGKTTVAGMFKKLGAVILDADKIAHRALYRNSPYYKKIVNRFGKSIVDAQGRIIKSALAKIAFKTKASQSDLCCLTHPYVFDYIDKKIKFFSRSKKVKMIVVEAALLIESGLYKKMDTIVVVISEESEQLKRAAVYRGMNELEAKQRMRYQMKLSQKIKYADHVIDNRHTFKHTESQVKKIVKKNLKNHNN
jgi:dephospho-CoA kinase